MSELVKRTLSGAVYVGCVVGCIVWNQWAVTGLIQLIGLLAVDEFHRRVESHPIQRFYAAVGVVILWLMTVFHTYPLVLVFAAMYLPFMFMSLLDELWHQ